MNGTVTVVYKDNFLEQLLNLKLGTANLKLFVYRKIISYEKEF